MIEKNVKLLLVDSVAAVARQEYSSIVHRQAWLNQQASLLKYIAERFEIPVVVTNQVTTRFNSHSDGGQENSSSLLPALGNTWSHCVNTRLVLDAEKTTIGDHHNTTTMMMTDTNSGQAPVEPGASGGTTTTSAGKSLKDDIDGNKSLLGGDGEERNIIMKRTLTVQKSPMASRLVLNYEVCERGITLA